jgi:hypothetical protein
MRKYNWSEKAIRRRTTGVGRCRHLKKVWKRFATGFKSSGASFPQMRQGQRSKESRKEKSDKTPKQAVASTASK